MTLNIPTAPLTSLGGTPRSSDLARSLQDRDLLAQVFYKLVTRHRENESCLDHTEWGRIPILLTSNLFYTHRVAERVHLYLSLPS